MRKIILALGLSLSVLLVACGGGGGSSGTTNQEYTISLRADRYQLPLNIADNLPCVGGAYCPYTTTLYVEARQGGVLIPGGIGIFGCNISAGLESGALYYFDGKHTNTTTGAEDAFRSISLDANSGGSSFHFGSFSKAGTATIDCTVVDPRDKTVKSASVDIVVGAATGLPGSVIAVAQAPRYLGSQYNTDNIRNNIGIQASVMDDANQPVKDPAAANLQVNIVPFGGLAVGDASAGAKLISGGQSGASVQVRTIGGIGLASLSSGPNPGVILLEFIVDRADNNVANDLKDPVVQLIAVPVVDSIPTPPPPLTVASQTVSAAAGAPFTYALSVTGGVPPYMWTLVSGGVLPSGLTLNSTGVVVGNGTTPAGTYVVAVRVTDAAGTSVVTNLTITIK